MRKWLVIHHANEMPFPSPSLCNSLFPTLVPSFRLPCLASRPRHSPQSYILEASVNFCEKGSQLSIFLDFLPTLYFYRERERERALSTLGIVRYEPAKVRNKSFSILVFNKKPCAASFYLQDSHRYFGDDHRPHNTVQDIASCLLLLFLFIS